MQEQTNRNKELVKPANKSDAPVKIIKYDEISTSVFFKSDRVELKKGVKSKPTDIPPDRKPL